MQLNIRNNIPNGITCLNLLCGAMACIAAFSFYDTSGSLAGYQWSFILIGAAALFDFCDGAAARLLGAYSPKGKELDSLADLISFGLAPALLMYNLLTLQSGQEFYAPALVSLVLVAGGALRLAKFNVDTRQTTSFIGLPIPANAIFWIGYITLAINGPCEIPAWVSMIVMVALALLMVSEIPMFSLKFKNFALKGNVRRYLILIAAVVFVISAGDLSGLAWTILLYVLMSLIGKKA
ncbi:MAG: CDP-diacylglycerol--serine O-phosphatidyltransferase [Muribaculaceae bacterium]|nr:CDP-diacylglycerol--serine O-phosphatidyltransferase [Muribaculaceae bacterium]